MDSNQQGMALSVIYAVSRMMQSMRDEGFNDSDILDSIVRIGATLKPAVNPEFVKHIEDSIGQVFEDRHGKDTPFKQAYDKGTQGGLFG